MLFVGHSKVVRELLFAAAASVVVAVVAAAAAANQLEAKRHKTTKS